MYNSWMGRYDEEEINPGKSSYLHYVKDAYGHKGISMMRASKGGLYGLQKLLREMPADTQFNSRDDAPNEEPEIS